MRTFISGILFAAVLYGLAGLWLENYTASIVEAALQQNNREWQIAMEERATRIRAEYQVKIAELDQKNYDTAWEEGYQTGRSTTIEELQPYIDSFIAEQEHASFLIESLLITLDSLNFELLLLKSQPLSFNYLTGMTLDTDATDIDTYLGTEQQTANRSKQRGRIFWLSLYVTGMIVFVTILSTIVLRLLQNRKRNRYRL